MRVKYAVRTDRGVWKVGNAFTVEIVSQGRENHIVNVIDHKFGGRFNYRSRPYGLWNGAYRDATHRVKKLAGYLNSLVGGE